MRTLIVILLALAGCRADTNSYYSGGGSTGPIHCTGAHCEAR